MKETDSWKTFERTGTVKDYLQYKSSVDRATKERMQLTCSVSERMEPEKKRQMQDAYQREQMAECKRIAYSTVSEWGWINWYEGFCGSNRYGAYSNSCRRIG